MRPIILQESLEKWRMLNYYKKIIYLKDNIPATPSKSLIFLSRFLPIDRIFNLGKDRGMILSIELVDNAKRSQFFSELIEPSNFAIGGI